MASFKESSVREAALEILQRHGITEPTPVQQAAIPVVRAGRDAVVQAPTGTGKTLAFLLPLMERLKAGVDVVQGLVVTPTRELAQQITRVAKEIAPAYGINVLAIYGGDDIERQKEKLGRHPQLIVGTPGRLLDHMRHRTLRLETASKIVLDEADEMLKLGFLEDVAEILKTLAKDRQILLFSATMPERVRGLARRFMTRPEEIRIENKQAALDIIRQTVVNTKEETKLDQLCEIINERQPYLMMVFAATRQRVRSLTLALARRGYLVDELSGDLTQSQRALVLRRFRQAELQVLVTTDIAARGLDIEGVTQVVNYDLPRTTEDYIHRVGRTGRAGHEGEAITFVTARQYDHLRRIEAGIRRRIDKLRPSRSHQKAKAREGTLTKLRSRAGEKKDKQIRPKGRHESRKDTGHKGRNQRSRRKPTAK